MAKVKFSGVVAGVRGKMAGMIFTASQSGATIRPYARPVNPKTSLQNFSRATFSSAGPAWVSIGATNRALWNAYALLPAQGLIDPWGDTYYVSGWNWFLGFHNRATMAGSTPAITPPGAARPSMPTIQSVVLHSGTAPWVRVKFAAGTFNGFYVSMQMAIQPATTSIKPGSSSLRLLYLGPFGALDNQANFMNLVSVFGYVLPGYSFQCRIARQTAAGDVSARASVIGVAS